MYGVEYSTPYLIVSKYVNIYYICTDEVRGDFRTDIGGQG
jgi:hypothetical protein